MISVIIPSIKKEIKTLRSVPKNPLVEIIISRKVGVAYARNWGARQAKGEILVFFDDDLEFSTGLWMQALSIKKGEFIMVQGEAFPITRVMSIYADDFWFRVGGFDERLTVGGEDRDFYFRAIEAGLMFKAIPSNQITHIAHTERSNNIHTAITLCSTNMKLLMKYGIRYPRIFKIEFLDRMKLLQVRTVLIQFVFLLYHLINNKYPGG